MSIDPRESWFGPKRFGWGWSPRTWEGWACIASYIILSLAGTRLLIDHGHAAGAVIYQALLTIGLILVCIVKGDPPSWHWGGK